MSPSNATPIPASPSGVTSGLDPTPIVDVVNVAKSFGETHALRDVTLQARAGEIHAIVGENGSGKSTLAKMISGIVLPDRGTVQISGQTVLDPRAAMRVGVATVFQEVLIAEGATVADNVYLGLEGPWRANVSGKDKYWRTAELLESLSGQSVDPDAPVESLPLALRQWVTIARSIVRKPSVIVFDESTAALDLDGTVRLYNEMQRLRDEGTCVLVVTHRIAELTSFADRATVLRDGKDVGVLEKAEITLDNLLELMSGISPANEETTPEEAEPHPDFDSTDPVLVANELIATPGAEPSDFVLRPGEIVGIAGLDGQGQSAYIKAISGIGEVLDGSVEVRDGGVSIPIDGLKGAEEARVAYISGDRRREGIFTNLSIFENFAMPLYRAASRFGIINGARVKSAYDQQMATLSLRAGSREHSITSLSGGNQQKVLIGRVLAQDPRVVTLNDPARGVDIKTKRELYRQLNLLADTGAGIVYLSTEIDELVGLCDRVAVFRGGSIFTWLDRRQIDSDRILGAMFGHMEKEFDIEDVMAGQE